MYTDRDVFTFNGVSSMDYGIYLLDVSEETHTYRDVDKIAISGRTGDLLSDYKRYANITVVYTCAVTRNADENVRAFNAALLASPGYHNLEDNFYPDYFRVGMYDGNLKPKISRHGDLAIAEFKFNCKPQRYLKTYQDFKISGTGSNVNVIAEGYGRDIFTAEALSNSDTEIDPDMKYVVVDCHFEEDMSHPAIANIINLQYAPENYGGKYMYYATDVNPIESTSALSAIEGVIRRGMFEAGYGQWGIFGAHRYVYFTEPILWEVYIDYANDDDVLKSKPYSNSAILINPTKFDSSPFIRVHFGDNYINHQPVVMINDQPIWLTAYKQVSIYGESLSAEDVYIDCDTMNAYVIADGITINWNKNVVLPDKSIVLKSGENVIYTNSFAEYIEITPRWWTL